MTIRFERVVIFKTLPQNMVLKPFDVRQLILIALTTSLLMYHHDYGHSIRCIFDFKEITMMHAFKLNLIQMHKFASIIQNMFKTKISGIEILNAPRVIPVVLRIAKILLSKKILSRITIHSDLSTLHENIPKESLPSDYGGHAESTEELLKKWDDIIETHQSFFEQIASLSRNDSNKDNNET